MINKEFIEENKKKLLAEKERLEKLLSEIADPNKDIEGDFKTRYEDIGDKPDENASEVALYEAKLAEERDMEERLEKIKAALVRIEKGTYGMCAVDGKPISEERLQAVPEAEYCIEHAE